MYGSRTVVAGLTRTVVRRLRHRQPDSDWLHPTELSMETRCDHPASRSRHPDPARSPSLATTVSRDGGCHGQSATASPAANLVPTWVMLPPPSTLGGMMPATIAHRVLVFARWPVSLPTPPPTRRNDSGGPATSRWSRATRGRWDRWGRWRHLHHQHRWMIEEEEEIPGTSSPAPHRGGRKAALPLRPGSRTRLRHRPPAAPFWTGRWTGTKRGPRVSV